MNNLNLWNPLSWGEIMIEGAHNKINMILTEIFKNIVLSSYWICVIGGVIGLILYLFGLKKGKDFAFIAPAIYMILKILGGVLIGI
ncbi:hypothetical protein [Romboutsia timonensis]|uniref:hypothetical protein n=1 Tax=Romboutsia timonensis TaxID=1776391 RepID=UPI0008D8E3D5|nr:hypothetical protein [Romboutsia timonensis]